jgi:uncharacterized protein YbaP (TraB family)
MLKSLLRRVAAVLGLSLLLGTVPAQARTPEVARPALWEVSDPDTTIYLFGTIHLLPDDIQWRSTKFNDAIAGSQQLVVETIVDDKNPSKLMSAMASLGFANGLPPLVQRVPAAKRPALEAAIKKSGFPPQAFDRMKTWAAAFILLGNQFRDLGLKGGQGVEQVLRGEFTTAGKPIGELETNVEQLGFFDKLPESAQLELLEGAIEGGKATGAEFAGMIRAWSHGDVQGIARTFDRDLSHSPALRQSLLHQRNANWSKWIEQRLSQPGTIIVAVGAGHLAGKDSVLEMLKKDGYSVRRLQ